MRDALEEHLATRLGALGDTVGNELPPPVDLELQVQRRRRRTRSTKRWSGVGIAAAIVAVVATVTVVHGTTGRSSLRVATSSSTLAPVHDSLQPGTVMLSARGPSVISLDADGTRNATMVEAEHRDVTYQYARATDDHRALWYLSSKDGSKACGSVVRADIDGRSSTIVTHAVAFDVSPDGSRLALYGGGDLTGDHCTPVSAGAAGRIVVRDLASAATSSLPIANVTSLRWSPDGAYLVAVSCGRVCRGYERIDVPAVLGAPLAVRSTPELYPARTISAATVEFGPDGLYALETTTPTGAGASARPTDEVARVDPGSMFATTPLFSGGARWDVSQVVPTAGRVYVVAAPIRAGATTGRPEDAGLYRIEGRRLVLVRPLPDPGTLTPVTPLPASGR